jgi:ribosomal protein S27AE
MIDATYQMVTCKECSKHYQCTPANDYYNNTTLEDGICETCMLLAANIHPDKIVTAIKCPRCGMVSAHPEDVREGYCGNCHDWTSRETKAQEV